ncbi:hypothetical protein [Hymenobacter baengnokdamensis]|uniref:hypothetical protein n=1 Tax=Hymenobacter baengnokdamensis TaxID=2615203 RepID=UPI001246668C|nr:hypothetical protein [Hymenobacter baengnokdamensis]
MTFLLNKEVQLRDLRHLASEIFELVKTTESAQAQRQQVAELAQTAWHKLHDIGPLMDSTGAFFKALNSGQIEYLHWDEVDGASPARSFNMLDATHQLAYSLWMRLEEAEFCSEALYADVRHFAVKAANAPHEAAARWDKAEQELLAEGVLPVQLLAPSAVGGARYVRQVYVPDYMASAFRETLAGWGAFIIRKWASRGCMGQVFAAHYYEISLEEVDDQFEIGKFTVMQYYTDLAGEELTSC